MPITILSALEIFTNPHDLEILVGQGKTNGKYVIAISRGPRDNFKMILDSDPFAEKLEDAIEAVEKILNIVQKVGTKEFGGNSILSEYLNIDEQSIDQSKVLNPGLIAKIIQELQSHMMASTYKIA
ncbi:MAG: hypothetical protein NTU85_00405 [Candidatus Kaiserbacteria bacterium]|nr:hypothetical protein [Candidatus Kaiserbacteria bacterium]